MKLIYVCVILGLIILFTFNIVVPLLQDKNFKIKLQFQNSIINFVNKINYVLLQECFRPRDFLKMHNSGIRPENMDDSIVFHYKRYSTDSDYYL